jgi:hypothetical protein
METLAMAIYMGAGPSVMYATHALEAFGQFAESAKPAEATLAPA